MPVSRKSGESKPKVTVHKEAGADKQDPSQDETQEFIFTINSATGELVKVEKLDMGQRQELSPDEYSSLSEAFPMASGTEESYSGYDYDPYTMLYAAYADPYGYGAYAQGAYDYAAALAAAGYDLSGQEE